MFKDYYAILDIDENSTLEQIKKAFKRQALKWHPDRNPGVDTTQQMQDINEAYLILKDEEARARYDVEYQIFKQYQKEKQKQGSSQKETYEEEQPGYSDYSIHDSILKKWMDNAKKQAVDLARQTIQDLRGMVSVGAKAAEKKLDGYLPFFIIGVVIFILMKGCSN